MTNLDLADIKVTSTFNLSLLTKQQLTELKFRTGKDMGEIISDLIATEHALLNQSNSPVAQARPSQNYPHVFPVGG